MDEPARSKDSGPGERAAAAAGPAVAAPLSDKAIRLARRYRYERVGRYGGSVLPWANVRYRLQAWHGIRTTISDLRTAVEQARPGVELT